MGLSGIRIIYTLQRRLVRTEPVTKSYEIQTLECPECESQVRLVQRTMSKCRPHRPVVQPYWRNVRIPGSAC
jgi:hypothetical protein